MEELNETCPQCKREVPKSNMTIHALRCIRNIDCKVCDATVPADEIDKHMLIHNKPVKCPDCATNIPQMELDNHRLTKCKERKIQCEYCEIDLREPEMEDHLLYCGTRTEQCEDCKEYVMFKYKQLHLDSNHTFLKLDDEPGPAASWDRTTKPPIVTPFDDAYENDSARYFAPSTFTTATSIPKQYQNGGSNFSFLRSLSDRNEQIFSRDHEEQAIAQRAGETVSQIRSALQMLRTNDFSAATNRMSRVPVAVPKLVDIGTGSGTNRMSRAHEQRMAGTRSGVVKKACYNKNKGKAPQPPPVGENDDETLLPCENCDGFFAVSELLKHQDRCSSRLRYTRNFSPPEESKSPLNLAVNRSSGSEISLPCEFCCDLYPASALLEHQNNCDVKY